MAIQLVPAALAAASVLFGLPGGLDMIEDISGYDVRGRKRRAARGIAAGARGAGRRHASAGVEDEVEQKYLGAALNRLGPVRQGGISAEAQAQGLGSVVGRLEERHAASLAAVDRAKQLPMSLQELAMRAGMRG